MNKAPTPPCKTCAQYRPLVITLIVILLALGLWAASGDATANNSPPPLAQLAPKAKPSALPHVR